MTERKPNESGAQAGTPTTPSTDTKPNPKVARACAEAAYAAGLEEAMKRAREKADKPIEGLDEKVAANMLFEDKLKYLYSAEKAEAEKKWADFLEKEEKSPESQIGKEPKPSAEKKAA